MHVANHFVESGTYRVGLIVNCEAGMRGYADFEVRSLEDLEPRLAAFTVGPFLGEVRAARTDEPGA